MVKRRKNACFFQRKTGHISETVRDTAIGILFNH